MTKKRRTTAELWEQYEIETELAKRLKEASKEERRVLYKTLYDELFQRVPHHPQLTWKSSAAEKARRVRAQMRFLEQFLDHDKTFLEIGAGDCALALEVAWKAKRVYAVDVSSFITEAEKAPENLKIVISDGVNIPVGKKKVDVAYSNQLMEHLHPEDALEQLNNIYKALAPGGMYICVTPNRLNGPHDISKHFDMVPRGFHLKEYTVRELTALFRKAGFARVRQPLKTRWGYTAVPLSLSILCEEMLKRFSNHFRKSLAAKRLIDWLLGIRLVGIK